MAMRLEPDRTVVPGPLRERSSTRAHVAGLGLGGRENKEESEVKERGGGPLNGGIAGQHRHSIHRLSIGGNNSLRLFTGFGCRPASQYFDGVFDASAISLY